MLRLEKQLSAETRASYRRALEVLQEWRVPFLVGGAFALEHYTGISRNTKDLDLFLLESDLGRALDSLSQAGFATQTTFPHWLGKACTGESNLDIIFCSGNGVSVVEDSWFLRAVERELLGFRVGFCAPEEILWTKAFIMERERFDGADVNHLLHCCEDLDWRRLVDLFGDHWQVLWAHLVLFQFVYPGRRDRIPAWVIKEFVARSASHEHEHPPARPICRGSLLSRIQYRVDLEEWGYEDARRSPPGSLTADQIEDWTRAGEE